jgi:hypothetical protein
MPTDAARVYHYKGWSYRQHRRGRWGLLRLSDGFQTWHQSRTGAEAFIRRWGAAVDPDAAALEDAGRIAG